MGRWGKGWARAPHFVLVLVLVLVLENCSPRGLDLPLTRPVDIPVRWALIQRFNRGRVRRRGRVPSVAYGPTRPFANRLLAMRTAPSPLDNASSPTDTRRCFVPRNKRKVGC